MTLGFVDPRFCGGFRCVLAVDSDRSSIATHQCNFGGRVVCRSIEEWLEVDPRIPQADVVIGGPPCQGFSLLNKKQLGDRRRALWEPYLDVVDRCGAKSFVMENVYELSRSRKSFHRSPDAPAKSVLTCMQRFSMLLISVSPKPVSVLS